MRTDKHGNMMKATEVNFQRVGALWDDPQVTFHSESLFPDGTPYRLADAEPDRARISTLVGNGILEAKEAEEIKRLLTKIYEGLGK